MARCGRRCYCQRALSSLADNPSEQATPTRRRHDAPASRQALLDAATVLFDQRGYDRTTVRDIGERAGVDAALIARYFGGKEGIYLATIRPERHPPLPTDPADAVAAIITRTDERGIGPVARAVVNPGLTDAVRDEVRRILETKVVRPLAAEMTANGAPDARLRAELLVALATGVSLTRASGTLPRLERASLARVLSILEPAIEALAQGPDQG
jgi:AcrR family transcriptional regulator